jgi:hypothetical protein
MKCVAQTHIAPGGITRYRKKINLKLGNFSRKKLFFGNENSWYFRNVDLDFGVPGCDII